MENKRVASPFPSNVVNHNSHFHIYLRTPTAVGIDSTQHLLADAATASPTDSASSTADLQTAAQGLLDYVQNITDTGDEIMFTMDVPYVPAQETPIVLAQAATPDAGVTPKPDYILTGCQETEHATTAFSGLDPAYGLKNALYSYSKGKQIVDLASIKTTLLEGPTHGKIFAEVDNEGLTSYHYDPVPNYVGKDKAVFMAVLDGKIYKIVVNLIVHLMFDEKTPQCSAPRLIKVNGKPVSGSSGYDLNSISVTFAALDGSSVGQTNASTITLDTNAAGYNWFIDATPGQNEEFLPTSNPNEWIAKAGSEAAGKMDLLSVLLHEYGHALGIEHSADGGDYMAATLQPGVRRLPSTDELALMAQLVGEIKIAQDNNPDTPINPSLPIGTTLSALLLGRLRRTDYGSWSPVFDSAQIPAPAPQFEIAANPKLQNPAFDAGTDWTTEGAVAFESGAATLTETAATQTCLSQVFVLGEHDRFLSFTLANTALGDQTGPDDAFEVALLDANTGLSLMGTTGLTHNDAILNLQANGAEHKASGITRIDNPDGSHTYLVDLAGIAAGTTVNLAFDLIGFGLGAEASNSRITVRDLRLGVPQTTDDSATLAEDTPTVINALTNDLNARQPGFAPVIVSAPAHGRVDFNLATVTLTVTPVSDAPRCSR